MRRLLAIVLVALAGCGGSGTKEKNAYVAAVNDAQQAFVAVVDQSASNLSANAPDDETARQLDSVGIGAAKVVRQLRAVDPPGDVKALHQRLIAEAQGLVTAFNGAADAYRSGIASRILDAKVQLSKDVARVNSQLNATIEALNRKLH